MDNLLCLIVFIGLFCGALGFTALIGKVIERVAADFLPDEDSCDEYELNSYENKGDHNGNRPAAA